MWDLHWVRLGKQKKSRGLSWENFLSVRMPGSHCDWADRRTTAKKTGLCLNVQSTCQISAWFSWKWHLLLMPSPLSLPVSGNFIPDPDSSMPSNCLVTHLTTLQNSFHSVFQPRITVRPDRNFWTPSNVLGWVPVVGVKINAPEHSLLGQYWRDPSVS